MRKERTEAEPLGFGSGVGSGSESESLSDNTQPQYLGPAAGPAAAAVDGRSMLERLTGGGKRPSTWLDVCNGLLWKARLFCLYNFAYTRLLTWGFLLHLAYLKMTSLNRGRANVTAK